MIETRQKITLDISNPNTISIVAKQKDYNSRFLDVTLVGNGSKIEIMPTSTVIINARRKDGQSKAFGGVVNENGTATVPLTYWILELGGSVYCDVSVVDAEGRKLTSTHFVIEVEKATFDGDEITEDENYDVLAQLIEDVNEATGIVKDKTLITSEDIDEDVFSNLDDTSLPTSLATLVLFDYYLPSFQFGATQIQNNAITTDKLANNSVSILKLGCETTTISKTPSSSLIPTEKAVADYVAEQIALLQAQIDELKGTTPTIHTEIELNNKGELVYSWYRDETTKGDVTKTNDGWSIVGYSASVLGGTAYTHFVLVGKTQQSVAMSGTGLESGSLTYNGETYYYTVKKVATQYVVDYGKAVQLEETYIDNATLVTELLDYYYGVE